MPASPPIEILVDAKPVVTLTPLDRRVQVGLVMPGLGRVIDISIQPTAACRALSEAAQSSQTNAAEVEAVTREAITTATEISGSWTPSPDIPLSAWFGGIAFPLLGAAYDAGGSPITEVPRWAEPILAAPSFGQGAIAGFGDRATRPVKRALVEAVRPLPTGQIPIGILALALIGKDILQPDRLARVLSCERAVHPASDFPDPSTLRASRKALIRWGEPRTERVLIDAAARPDGLAVLLRTVRYALQLGDHGPTGRLPSRLTELHDSYRVLIPTATQAAIDPPPQRTRRCADTAGGRGNGARRRRSNQRDANATNGGAAPVPHPVLRAPVINGTPPRNSSPQQRIKMPANIRSLDGVVTGDLKFVLPRTIGDLARWGRLMSNCLQTFGTAVSAGQSFIIGIEREGWLVYAIEITNSGNIRQFNGRANRQPSDKVRKAVITELLNAGAINPRSANNRRWM